MNCCAMRARFRATDRTGWKDAIDPDASRRLVAVIDQLAASPVLDGTVTRILSLCDDPDSTTADLVATLEGDAAFAASVLRFANSAACARPIRAETIRQAVMLVGRQHLRRLSLEVATSRFLDPISGYGAASFGQLYQHGLAVATMSAAVAEHTGVPADTAHLAGLLHDIGKLVMPRAFGEEAVDELIGGNPHGASRVLAERERFGIDHAQAGALLAERWGCPAEVATAIALHHGGTTGLGSSTECVASVQLANEVVAMLGGSQPDHDLMEIALERIGLEVGELEALAARVSLPGESPEAGAGSHGGGLR